MVNWLLSSNRFIYFRVALRLWVSPERVYAVAHSAMMRDEFPQISGELRKFGILNKILPTDTSQYVKVINTDYLDQMHVLVNESSKSQFRYHNLQAMEPGSKQSITRNEKTDMSFILIRGVIKLHLYDEKKKLLESVVLNPLSGTYGVTIPMGMWYSYDVLTNGTVIVILD